MACTSTGTKACSNETTLSMMLSNVSGNSVWHARLAVGGRVAWMFTPRNRRFGYPRGQVAAAAYRPRTARAADLPTTRLSHLHSRGLARPSARNTCGEKAADRLRLSRGRLPPEQTNPPAGRRWPGRHAGAPRLCMIVLTGRKKAKLHTARQNGARLSGACC